MSAPHIILTAGPTIEPIDPVRFLSNRSSGKQGYALAGALAARGARVTLVSGPVSLETPPDVTRIDVETALEMMAAVEAALPADVFVGVAAVADWRPAERHAQKLKTDKAGFASLKLAENPDILRTIAHLPPDRRPALVIGFAAETEADPVALETLAHQKMRRKNCDMIIANDVSGGVMGGDHNTALVVSKEGTSKLPHADKSVIAAQLADTVMALLGNHRKV